MDNTERLYQTLLESNKDALNEQLFTVAYHALAAALNCAISLQDIAKLEEVERIGREQWQTIRGQVTSPSQSNDLSLYSTVWHIAQSRLTLLKHNVPQ